MTRKRGWNTVPLPLALLTSSHEHYLQPRLLALTEQQVRDYFLFLKNEKKFAPASLKMAFYGICYFYTHTVPREGETLKRLRVAKHKTLPDVLTVEEVRRLIDAVRTPHNKPYL